MHLRHLPIFLAAAMAFSCTRRDASVTLTYPAAKPQKNHAVQVDFLTYSEGKADGNVHPARIQAGPNPDKALNVGIAQDLSGGLGGQWQAAVWIAAFQAAAALGRDLSDYAIMVRGQGYIDGPSAGALFAAGMMAAMAGIPVRPEVTMTGIVNPDGTVGPVGGIPNKFRAAVKAGKKILGYPVGQRYSVDLATQKVVDLHEFAKENGVQVMEIRSVDDAFTLLTGKQVPRVQPLTPEQLALPAATIDSVNQKAGTWQERYNRFVSSFYAEKLQDLMDSAQKLEAARNLAEMAEAQKRSGQIHAAYDLFQSAAAEAFAAYAYGRFIQYTGKGKFVDLFQEVSSMFNPVSSGLEQSFETARTFSPKNFEETSAFLCMLEQSIAALGYTQDAARSVESARSVMENVGQLKDKNVPPDQIISAIVSPLLSASSRYGKALMAIEKGKDLMGMRNADSAPFSISGERLESVAKIYIAVAQANMNYIDQIFIPDLARSAETDENTVRDRLVRKNDSYMLAFTGLRFPQSFFKEKWGERAAGTFWAQIAGSMGSYFASSMFLMHHYSLGVENNGATVRMEKVLDSMLDRAEYNVRLQAARLLHLQGTVPASVRFFHAVGMALKNQTPALKLKSLEMFWRASMLCQLSIQLTRPAP